MILEMSAFMLWVLSILGAMRLFMWILKMDRPREILVPVERTDTGEDWENKNL